MIICKFEVTETSDSPSYGLYKIPGPVKEIYRQENIQSLAKSIPAQKIGSADDFGKVAAFLCSEHANFITGTAIPVAGGTYGGLQ